MAIYAFDFDEVARTIKDLNETASNLESNLENYKTNVASDLSTWQSDSSQKFDSNTEQNCKTISDDIDTIRGMSAYLSEISDVISSAEEDLASIKI